MLRFSLGVTRLDRIRNEYIRGTAHVGRLGDKVREARLRWFGHVQRRDRLFIDFRISFLLVDYTLWIIVITLPNSLPVPDFVSARPLSPAWRMDPATSASGGAPSQNTSPTMDPAELCEIVVWQGAIILSYQDQVEALQDQLRSASIAAPPAARGESPRLALPDKFDGTADCCQGFLRQCEVFFSHQPGIYHVEETQCAFLMSLLTSRALEWASAVWDADPQIRSSFSYFTGMIREVFEYPAGGNDISLQLMELRQGSDTAADYAIKFRTLAAQSGWNDAALWAVFLAGLNPDLQTELACQAGSSRSATGHPQTWLDYPSFREEAPEPMQLGRSRLTEQVHRQHGQMRLCYNCGASRHLSPQCPEKSSSAQS
ncbi:hypothetical protein QTP70_007545 [Hemibagrus guttatus]|uniref:CCHC-type domain-containing protein n=1 Tax=Hemibagrus guttatus TaxID=175788 RepID=A0AAE0QMJ0_9TELE|nr:hypothetical protein QTP70_007545 [Hemibagrus guttatus]